VEEAVNVNKESKLVENVAAVDKKAEPKITDTSSKKVIQ
jgi:hypothetical protein